MLAAQWAYAVDAPQIVWVEQWRTWLPELVSRYRHSRILDRRQRAALWQQVIHEAPGGFSLVNLPALAAWASEAWTILRTWEAEGAAAAGESEALQALAGWGRRYEQILRERGWSDRENCLSSLDDPVVRRALETNARAISLLDIGDLAPLERNALNLLERAGWRVHHRSLPSVHSRVEVRAARTRAEEIELALDWLSSRLDGQPGCRVALVAEHDSVLDAIVRRRSEEWSAAAFARGTCPREQPAISAAMNALDMLGPQGNSQQLSSWLRSPFMQSADPQAAGAAARVELARRELLVAQLPLLRARAGLLQQLADAAPDAAFRLRRALECSEGAGSVMQPADWARLWRAQLGALGWLDGASQIERDEACAVIERAFDSVAALGAVLGAVNSQRALDELREVLGERLIGSPMPVNGLHVLEHVEEIGPGYAAVWVSGMSRSKWPPRPRRNPLLPRRLLRELRVPWASREDCLERAGAAVRRIAGAAEAVAFSYSPDDDEQSAQPAAMLQPWLTGPGGTADSIAESRRIDAGSVVLGERGDCETVHESMQPLRQQQLSGGASLLDKQALCPLRALIDHRLLVRPILPIARGIAPAVRGQILHRAAAHLLCADTDAGEIAASGEDWSGRIAASAEYALQHEFGDARGSFETLVAMERLRIVQVLELLLEAERRRSDFTIDAVEHNARFGIDDYELSGRIDRIDRLPSGGFAVIDYKSGRDVAQPRWLDADSADYQMPLYALALDKDVTALVLCTLRPVGIDYRGFWADANAFPGRSAALAGSLTWADQLSLWHEEIAALLRAFVAGDPSVDFAARELLEGQYAPLSRIAESPSFREAASMP